MEQLNSTSSRSLTPAESMQRLEKAVFASDARIKIRLDQTARSRQVLGLLFALPFSCYFIYNTMSPFGVMQNHRASSGAYMYWAQNFLGPSQTFQQIYRPEFYTKEHSMSLYAYSKKIQQLRNEDALEEGVHHPTSWH